MKLRKTLFWIHLAAGSVAGTVIFVMALSGVCLAFERQLTDWYNRGYKSRAQTAEQKRLSMDELLAKVRAAQGATPTAITVNAAADGPVQLGFGRDRAIFVDAYSGETLGEGSGRLRGFFSVAEVVHRFLGAGENRRAAGRAVTGACNLAFLALLCTGPFLWWPKDWRGKNLRQILLFRGGLSGRARDWNWHNVIGAWCFAPLFLIVLSGVVMSYPWANNLLYRMTGNQLPPIQAPNREQPREVRGGEGFSGSLDGFFLRAEQQVSGWQSVSLRLPAAKDGPLTFAIDRGNGGRPDQRAQLTFDPKSGEVTPWEPFSSYNLGRRLRAWGRFAHTGEAGGILGQSIAATASAGAAVLVWTGLALALRRCNGWRKRPGLRAPAQS